MFYKAQNTDVAIIINFSLTLREYRIERKIRKQISKEHFLLHLRGKKKNPQATFLLTGELKFYKETTETATKIGM